MIAKQLQSNLFHLRSDIVEAPTTQDVLAKIRKRAIAKWGDKWMARLATEYAAIARTRGDEKATAVTRRAQLERAFNRGSCTLETAIILAAAVGCRFQMACIEIEIENF